MHMRIAEGLNSHLQLLGAFFLFFASFLWFGLAFSNLRIQIRPSNRHPHTTHTYISTPFHPAGLLARLCELSPEVQQRMAAAAMSN